MRYLLMNIFFLVSIFCLSLFSVSAQGFKCSDKIVLTHAATGAHLHSHAINYTHPGSSGQQQITGYQGSDNNDVWVIQDCSAGPLKNGSQIRLQHFSTGMYLHSHANIPSPITQGQQEVSGWTGKDNNDFWRIEIDGGGNWTSGKRFRLIHVGTNVALHSHNITGSTLPPQQQEITGYSGRDENDLWTADIAPASLYESNGQNKPYNPNGQNKPYNPNGQNDPYNPNGSNGPNGPNGFPPRDRVFRGNIQRSDVSARLNLSDNGRLDYSFSIRNNDQYVGSCAVFYIILTDNRGNIIKTFGGDQYCADAGVNNRAGREDRLSATIDRNTSSAFKNVQVIVTQGGKISPDAFRGNFRTISDITNSCPDCIKILSESAGGFQR